MDRDEAHQIATALVTENDSKLRPVKSSNAGTAKASADKTSFTDFIGSTLSDLLKSAGKAAFVALMIYAIYRLIEKRADIWDMFSKAFPGLAGMLSFLSPKGASVVSPRYYKDSDKITYSYDQISEICEEYEAFCSAIGMSKEEVLKVAMIANYLNLDKVRLLAKVINDGRRVTRRSSEYRVLDAVVH